MIRGRLSDGTLILGLSRQNIDRLIAGKPIRHLELPSMEAGVACFPPLLIVFGETEDEMLEVLRGAFGQIDAQVSEHSEH